MLLEVLSWVLNRRLRCVFLITNEASKLGGLSLTRSIPIFKLLQIGLIENIWSQLWSWPLLSMVLIAKSLVAWWLQLRGIMIHILHDILRCPIIPQSVLVQPPFVIFCQSWLFPDSQIIVFHRDLSVSISDGGVIIILI